MGLSSQAFLSEEGTDENHPWVTDDGDLEDQRLPLNLEHVPPVCGWKHFYGQLTAAVLSTYNCLAPSMFSVISPVIWLQLIAFR